MSTDKSQRKSPQAEQENSKHDLPTPPQGEHSDKPRKPLPYDDGNAEGVSQVPDPTGQNAFV